MYATKSPMMKMRNGVIGVKFAGNIDMYVDTARGTGPHLITINCVSNKSTPLLPPHCPFLVMGERGGGTHMTPLTR